jgi:hypothetical protein
MKKMFFYATIVFTTMSSCSKNASLTQDEQMEPTVAAAASKGINAVPISESSNFDYYNYIWNSCANEWVQLSGTGHFQLRGMLSEGKITYVLHFNLSNVRGVGLNTGNEFLTTQSFNYSNTASFTGDQQVYQQIGSIHFINPSGDASFTIENDWHLTVNANGDATFFFTTGGDVVTCQ